MTLAVAACAADRAVAPPPAPTAAPVRSAETAPPPPATSDAGVAAAPAASCGAEVERAWARIGVDGDPAATAVKMLNAFAAACATVAPELARAARAAAVPAVDARVRALAAAAYPFVDSECKFASTEPMAEHPVLPRCLLKRDRPDVADSPPFFRGRDPGILCDVNVGTYLFLVAVEPYLGAESHVVAEMLLVTARETAALKRTCWAHRR